MTCDRRSFSFKFLFSIQHFLVILSYCHKNLLPFLLFVLEVQMYEALGFAPYGQGIKFIKEGHSLLNGKLPVNTGGGLIAFGHPVGATGVKQIVEIYKQMKGKCEQYQIPRIPQIGLTANMGGSDKTSVVSIFKNL